jgi:hypothetical protein
MEVSLDEARIAAENLSRVRLERDLRECVLFYVQLLFDALSAT